MSRQGHGRSMNQSIRNSSRDGGNGEGRGRGRGRSADSASTSRSENESRSDASVSSFDSTKRSRNEEYGSGSGSLSSYGGSSSSGSDRGRGRGRGSQRGGHDQNDCFDLVNSRPAKFPGPANTKQGSSGEPVKLAANFFPLRKSTNWCLLNYRVDFHPEEERTHIKKALLRVHSSKLGNGAYIFDGSNMWITQRLDPEPMVLYSVRDSDKEKIELTIKFTSQIEPGDVTYLQFYNIIIRKCLQTLNFEEIGRHFYDRNAAIRMEQERLELWPGYITSMRNHENQIMLCVDITHKVLSLDNCNRQILELKTRIRDVGQYREAVNNAFVGNIVMTRYNRNTYRIDDIDWDKTPAHTFDMKGQQVRYVDYYHNKYQIRITNLNQPLLISRPTKRDTHRGQTNVVHLVPEICIMTGLSDEIRSNFRIMRELAKHLHQPPEERFRNIRRFMTRIKESPEISAELKLWGLDFDDRLATVTGRIVPKEKIIFKNETVITPDDKADWRQAFRTHNMHSSKRLDKWVIIVTHRDYSNVDNFIRAMSNVGRPLGFNISPPLEVKLLADGRIETYMKALDDGMKAYGKVLQLFFIILPNNKVDLYSAVKRRCCIDIGIASQCFVAKNLDNPKGVMSIATKVVIQINAKLGGEPWAISNPLKASNVMVIGFDVHHCGKRTTKSVGAMVATVNHQLSKFYSTVSFHENKDTLTTNLTTDLTKCLMAFYAVNADQLPDRIILFRDGVGDGQLSYVYNIELEQIKTSLNSVYKSKGRDLPKFSMIIVTKKINARIAAVDQRRGTIANPQAGTIVDDVITLPERWDFYLVSQSANQGTVSPTCYNVLFDQQGLDADKMQRFAYKLCHMYFNWSGTVAVPAPCQYAHKLAFLTGVSLKDEGKESLSHQLFYL